MPLWRTLAKGGLCWPKDEGKNPEFGISQKGLAGRGSWTPPFPFGVRLPEGWGVGSTPLVETYLTQLCRSRINISLD